MALSIFFFCWVHALNSPIHQHYHLHLILLLSLSISLRRSSKSKRVLDIVGNHGDRVFGRDKESGTFDECVSIKVMDTGLGVSLATLATFELGLDHDELVGLDGLAVVQVQVCCESDVVWQIWQRLLGCVGQRKRGESVSIAVACGDSSWICDDLVPCVLVLK